MQKRSLNEVFAKIQAQHVRQFGTSNQTHVLGGEEGAEEATANSAAAEEAKTTGEKRSYGYKRAQ